VPIGDLAVHSSQIPRNGSLAGFKVREDVLFTDAKGNPKPKLQSEAEQALERLQDPLRRLLEPDESILFITKAQVTPGAGEQLMLGWHVYTLPRVALIFTNRRILCLRVRTKRFRDWKWDRGIHTIRWGDLEFARAKGLLSQIFKLKMRNGEKVSYWRITRNDGKKINLLVETFLPHAAGESSAPAARDSLCPQCLATLIPRQYECPGCRLAFKTEKELFWRGIVIPGGASFYIGMTMLGALRLLFESFFLIAIMVFIWEGMKAGHATSGEEKPLEAAIGLVVILLLEKLIAIAVSRRQIRDFLPAG
jgi:hypothetical protein